VIPCSLSWRFAQCQAPDRAPCAPRMLRRHGGSQRCVGGCRAFGLARAVFCRGANPTLSLAVRGEAFAADACIRASDVSQMGLQRIAISVVSAEICLSISSCGARQCRGLHRQSVIVCRQRQAGMVVIALGKRAVSVPPRRWGVPSASSKRPGVCACVGRGLISARRRAAFEPGLGSRAIDSRKAGLRRARQLHAVVLAETVAGLASKRRVFYARPRVSLVAQFPIRSRCQNGTAKDRCQLRNNAPPAPLRFNFKGITESCALPEGV